MKRHNVELESTLVAMFAALPLYFTGPISVPATLFFHAVMAVIVVGHLMGRPVRLTPGLLGLLGFAYLLFFPIDAVSISRSLIRASTHLLFFIAAYQAFEAAWKDNHAQRVLVTFLIFVTSIATSTNISILLFVIVFTVLIFRELMTLSWERTVELTGERYTPESRNVQSLGYIVPTLLIAILFFPLLPRLRNPFVRGPSSVLTDQATGITEAIDLNNAQYGSNDPGVVARIWMSVDALPFFTPIRLKGAVYDFYDEGSWKSSPGRVGQVWARDGKFVLARPEGLSTELEIQQRPTADRQLFLPVGAYTVDDVGPLYWGRGLDRVVSPVAGRRTITYKTDVAQRLVPFTEQEIRESGYPYDDRVRGLATQVIGNAQTPREMAAKIETWMTTEFSYLPNAVDRDPMTLDQFLFEERRGHCEFFAAGMVVLLGSLDVPARIVGGFYGGELNPLGRYFVIRRSDAHAWVEVFDGQTWTTYDPTPPDLRPGASAKAALLQYLSAVQDTVVYFWDRWVLTFGLSDQIEFTLVAVQQLRETLAGMGASFRGGRLPRIPPWGLVLPAFLLAAVVVFQMIRARRRSLFEELAEHLDRLGYRVEESSTAGEIMSSLRRQNPGVAMIAAPVLRCHEIERFSGRAPGDDLRTAARAALRKLAER